MWLDPSLSYKFILHDSDDVLQMTVDNVVGTLTLDAVATDSIQDSAVTTAKLANDSVTSAKLADSVSTDGDRAVTTNHIRDANVTRDKLATGAVGKKTVVSKTTTFTASASEDVYLCSASGGAYTGTLPTAVGIGGKVFEFQKTDSGTNIVTIDADGIETIGGALTFKLAMQFESLQIISDGTNWQILRQPSGPKCKATTATQTVTNTDSIVIFSTKVFDSHSAYSTSTGIYTVPVAGTYRVSSGSEGSAAQASTVGGRSNLTVRKNSTTQSQLGSFVAHATGANLSPIMGGSTLVQCAVNDTLDIAISRDANLTNYALTNGATLNWVCFERVSE